MDGESIEERLTRIEAMMFDLMRSVQRLETLLALAQPAHDADGSAKKYLIETSAFAHSWTDGDGTVHGFMTARPVK